MSKRKRRSPKPRYKASPLKQRGWLLLATLAAALLVAGGAVLFWPRSSQPSAAPQVTGAPRAAVSQEVVDYGDVKINSSVETVFRVQNVGDQPLKILGEPQVELVQGC
ncbi:MAG: hypothetical protein P8186_27135 [Anaerolineae bacterium]|jgi:hypothetical protein